MKRATPTASAERKRRATSKEEDINVDPIIVLLFCASLLGPETFKDEDQRMKLRQLLEDLYHGMAQRAKDPPIPGREGSRERFEGAATEAKKILDEMKKNNSATLSLGPIFVHIRAQDFKMHCNSLSAILSGGNISPHLEGKRSNKKSWSRWGDYLFKSIGVAGTCLSFYDIFQRLHEEKDKSKSAESAAALPAPVVKAPTTNVMHNNVTNYVTNVTVYLPTPTQRAEAKGMWGAWERKKTAQKK